MDESLVTYLLERLEVDEIISREHIQSLWSDYGEIFKMKTSDPARTSIIVKHISIPTRGTHPRGWDTGASNKRKIKSYEVETNWYKIYNEKCVKSSRTANYLGSKSIDNELVLLLEDLDEAGFSKRRSELTPTEAKSCLSWLASFHATFINHETKGLWGTGTYWHLQTRKDEYSAMSEGSLKQFASELDERLNLCKYHTIVHGDAKVANFCFNESFDAVAVVDFQYVGKGCGMKDLAYFLGSCLNSDECFANEAELLDFYFQELKESILEVNPHIDFNELESEWRELYPIAWADFARFLEGWMPTHTKLNDYSAEMVKRSLQML